MIRWIAALCCLLLTSSAWADELTLDVLDIGQGDALLIRHEGKVVLIDAGVKKRLAAELLQKHGIGDIQLIVATHPHADHIGGMVPVLEQHKVGVYVDNGLPHTTRTYEQVMTLIESQGVRYRPAKRGQVYKLGADARMKILWPGPEPLTGTRSDLNSNSVVIRLEHGDDCILLTGDAEEPTEHGLLADELETCEVLKVAHHGGNHSSSPAFLDRLAPKIALISAGQNNRYGHPGEETLARLEARDIEVYRTDQMGEIRLTSTGRGVRVTTGGQAVVTPPDNPHVGPAGGGIDLNVATAAQLETLPGIGPGKARAIVEDRQQNGPFATVDDLTRVPGVGAGTLAKLRAEVSVGGGAPHHPDAPHLPQDPAIATGAININVATAVELETLPGIGPSKARAIVEFRGQRGPFSSCQDLTSVSGIGKKTVANISAMCRVQ